jgi:hypothetical protein
VAGRVLARYSDGRCEEIDLGPAAIRLQPALDQARLLDDAMGRDVVLVAVSGNSFHPWLLESPFDEGFCCLGGVSTVPEVGMHSIAELNLPLGVRLPLKAGRADDGSAFPLDEEPDAVPKEVRILTEQPGVEGQKLCQFRVGPLVRQSRVE